MTLSVVIPAHNEEGSIEKTVRTLTERLGREAIDHEVIVVDDHSSDRTADVVAQMSERDARVRVVCNPLPNGFGFAVRAGLEAFSGDAVAIVMADLSDDPDDVVAYHRVLE